MVKDLCSDRPDRSPGKYHSLYQGHGCNRQRRNKIRNAGAITRASSRWLPTPTPLPHIDAKRAFEYTREVAAFGERYMGNENHKKLEHYILDHLKGDDVEEDTFIADTVEGKFPVRNIIAKYPGTKDGIIVIMGHYDTNYWLRNTGYVGANDGGSSTAILIEFANQLRGGLSTANKKRAGYSVWLVWTDGEEAVKTWSDTDSLYGTRHLAEKWEKDGTLNRIKALMVMDMIGDADPEYRPQYFLDSVASRPHLCCR